MFIIIVFKFLFHPSFASEQRNAECKIDLQCIICNSFFNSAIMGLQRILKEIKKSIMMKIMKLFVILRV